MKIAIIGAGAMGSLYGAKFSQNKDNQVYLIDTDKELVNLINKKGLSIIENEKTNIYENITACYDSEEIGVCQLVVLFVKSTETAAAVKMNKELINKADTVLTLQNGLGNIESIKKVAVDKNILGGTTAHGATVLEPAIIRHAGYGKTIIGELDGSVLERTNCIAGLFNEAGFETEISENVLGLIWDKLIINAGINALTGITGLKNGELINNKEIEPIMEAAVNEALSVCKAIGIKSELTDHIKKTKEVCLATAENKSSMLQDILNKRITEIDMINGAIVKLGERENVATPVNFVLTNLIKNIQNRR